MGFYEDKRDLTVKPMLEKYGAAMQLLVPAVGGHDPETGGYTPGTETVHTVQGLVGTYRKRSRSGDAIQSRNQYVYISPSGMTVAPMPGHKLKVDGVEYEIVDVETISPGGTAVLYQVEVRLP